MYKGAARFTGGRRRYGGTKTLGKLYEQAKLRRSRPKPSFKERQQLARLEAEAARAAQAPVDTTPRLVKARDIKASDLGTTAARPSPSTAVSTGKTSPRRP